MTLEKKIDELKVIELKEELIKRGKSTTGNRNTLLIRLIDALKENSENVDTITINETSEENKTEQNMGAIGICDKKICESDIEKIKEMFKEIKENTELLPTLSIEIKELKNKIVGMDENLKLLNTKIAVNEKNIEQQNAEIIKLKKENEGMKSEIKLMELQLNGQLKLQIRNLEQRSRCENIEINGVVELPNENVENIIFKVGSALEIDVDEIKFKIAHRVPTRNPKKHKPIVVQLNSKEERNKWIAKWKLRRGLKNSDLGFEGNEDYIYVGEHLIPELKILLNETRKIKNEKNYKFVWVRDGRIYIRKDEGSKIININSSEDLIGL